MRRSYDPRSQKIIIVICDGTTALATYRIGTGSELFGILTCWDSRVHGLAVLHVKSSESTRVGEVLKICVDEIWWHQSVPGAKLEKTTYYRFCRKIVCFNLDVLVWRNRLYNRSEDPKDMLTKNPTDPKHPQLASERHPV
eukprot:516060-Pyramimonas_sp.AAC.1